MADDRKWIGESGEIEPSTSRAIDRPSRWTAKRVASMALVVVLVVLVLQNTSTTHLTLLLFQVSFPLWLLLGGMVVVSFLAGWLFGSRRRGRRD